MVCQVLGVSESNINVVIESKKISVSGNLWFSVFPDLNQRVIEYLQEDKYSCVDLSNLHSFDTSIILLFISIKRFDSKIKVVPPYKSKALFELYNLHNFIEEKKDEF